MHAVKPCLIALLVSVSAVPLAAQWPSFPNSPGIPKTPDGKVDLKAPAPRTPDGKPDLSGVWETAPCPDCAPPVIDGLSPTPGSGQAAAQGRSAAPPAAQGQPPGQQGPARGNAPAGAGGRGRGNPFARNVFGNVGGS